MADRDTYDCHFTSVISSLPLALQKQLQQRWHRRTRSEAPTRGAAHSSGAGLPDFATSRRQTPTPTR
jgi:hypothetical protein